MSAAVFVNNLSRQNERSLNSVEIEEEPTTPRARAEIVVEMEICIDSVSSAINAEKAGASRVELCSNLIEGGTTPSLGTFQVIKELTAIPVFVMVRPRGGDFLYSDTEFDVMRKEIEIFKEHKADGFVFGILNSDGTVDKKRNKELLDLCRPSKVTFHRAFDVTVDGNQALEHIIEMGFDRILTSGMEATVLEGLPFLKQLVDQAGDRIIIVPGGGISEKNLSRILDGCNAKEFHGSARSSEPSGMEYTRSGVPMGGALYPAENVIKTSNINRIRTMIDIAKL
eukprot:TCONS_00021926-protein